MLTVQRAVQVLWLLASVPGGLTLAEITRKLGGNRTSLHRLITSLQAGDLVRRDIETRRYLVGYGVLTMAGTILRSEDWISIARPILGRLRDASQETVTLAVRSGTSWIRVVELEAPRAVRFSRGIGEGGTLRQGASGKVLLAYLDEAERAALRPCLDEEELAELAAIRAQGYATSSEDLAQDAFAVAAPVLRRDRVIAALAVVAPRSRVDGPTARTLTELVQRAAGELSQRCSLTPLTPYASGR